MHYRIASRTARLCIVASAAAVLTVLSLSSTHMAAAAPVPFTGQTVPSLGSRVAVDPVGSYEWSLVMTSMDNTTVTGTMNVTRKDSTLSATLTSDHSDGELTASSVKLDGDRLTVVTNGDFGQFTVNVDFRADSLEGTFHFVGQDGSAADGPMSIKRTK